MYGKSDIILLKKYFKSSGNPPKKNKNGVICDYSFANDDWKNNLFSNETEEAFGKIMDNKLPDYDIKRVQLTYRNVYKYKLK